MPVPIFYPVQTHYAAADQQTRQVIRDVIAHMDQRHLKPFDLHTIEGLIAGVLALRGHKLRFVKAHLSEDEKQVAELLKDETVGVLLKRHGATYSVHPKLPKSFIIDQSAPDLSFRVQNDWVRWSNSSSIPSADLVGTISNRRAVTLKVPQIDLIMGRLMDGQELPPRFHRLESQESDAFLPYAEDVVADYRKFVALWMKKLGYLGVLINGSDLSSLEFAVTAQHAEDFPHWLEVKSRRWFREQGIPYLQLPAEITRQDGQTIRILGESTQQNAIRGRFKPQEVAYGT